MEKFLKNKKAVIALIVVVVLVLGGGAYFMTTRNAAKKQQAEEVLNNQEAIPTVDSSVLVSLKALTGKKEVELSVSGIPSGTKSVQYELSYDAQGQGPQGAIGNADLHGESTLSKKVTLGTCSSGTCVYHTVVGAIKLSLLFEGSYGQKSFEKEYNL